MKTIDVTSHQMVPRHTILTPEEAEEVFKTYGITKTELPKILMKDPVIKIIGAKDGDIIKIERASETAGISLAYRRVVD